MEKQEKQEKRRKIARNILIIVVIILIILLMLLSCKKTEPNKSTYERKYLVEFINEEKEYEAIEVKENEEVERPEDPSKKGYEFKYWETEEGRIYNFAEKVKNDIKLYAVYEKKEEEQKKYKVVYKNEDGSILQEEEVKEGEKTKYKGDTPTKKADKEYTYIFKGFDKEEKEIKEDTEYIATYKKEKNKYKIVYKNEDGSKLQEENLEYGSIPKYKGATPSKETTKEETYVFIGWDKEEKEVTENKEYIARYERIKKAKTYTVTYIDKGEEIEKKEYTEGSIIIKGKEVSKEGYEFKGWYTKENKKQEFPITVKEDIELTSKYEIKKYKVIYYDAEEKIEEQEIKYKEKARRPISNPEKEGYEFVGWVIKGSNKIYDFNEEVKSNINLESSYKRKDIYEVNYVVEGITVLREEVIKGEKAEKIEDPVKKGYKFDKWYKDEECTQEYDFNEEVMGNITIYGRYNENRHKVIYMNEGIKYAEEEVLDRYKARKPEIDPEKEGYEFKYWERNSEEYEFNTEVTKDIILTAAYEIKKYKIEFRNIDGEVLQRENLEYLSMPTYKGETPKKNKTEEEIYVFEGWDKEIEEVTKEEIYVARYKSIKRKYEVVFKNEDGNILQEEELEYGEIPEYKKEEPEKEKTEEYEYEFIGWNRRIEIVTEDIEYIARYKEEKRKYTVEFKEEDGSLLQRETLEYGSMPEYKSEVPIKGSTNEDTYVFIGWDKEIEEVRSNQEYVAVFKNVTNIYIIRFRNEDGEVLQEEILEYGEEVEYKGEEPKKESTNSYRYEFKGWNKEIRKVDGDEEYIATYEEKTRKYNIKFKDYDGSVLQEEELEYGETPEYKEELPSKEETEQYTYTYIGWNKGITTVTEDTEYVARYEALLKKYKITYKNEDGSVLQEEDIDYGCIPEYKGATPSKESTAQYTYTFSGWDKVVEAVSKEAEYIAQYTATLRSYQITYKNHDGTVLQRSNLNYGATPTYSGATPSKASTAQYTYTFSGWSPAETTVQAEAEYTAQYTATTRSYTVTFKNGSATYETQTVTYGGQATKPGTNPVKSGYEFKYWSESDGGSEYNFSTAITGTKTLYAVFGSDPTKCAANNVTVGSGIVCMRATTLNSAPCKGYCDYSYKTGDTIVFGNCGTRGTLKQGDAFDCDVTGTGQWERFYYVSDYYNTSTKTFDTSTATLIYSNNTINGVKDNREGVSGANLDYNNRENGGQAGDNAHGPEQAITHLPKTSQWPNISLKNTTRAILNEQNGNTTVTSLGYVFDLNSSFSYSGYSARLLTYQEIANGRDLFNGNDERAYLLSEFNYLFENTKYTNYTDPNYSYTYGYWLETVSYNWNMSAYKIYSPRVGFYRQAVGVHDPYSGVRPAIDMPKSKMNY